MIGYGYRYSGKVVVMALINYKLREDLTPEFYKDITESLNFMSRYTYNSSFKKHYDDSFGKQSNNNQIYNLMFKFRDMFNKHDISEIDKLENFLKQLKKDKVATEYEDELIDTIILVLDCYKTNKEIDTTDISKISDNHILQSLNKMYNSVSSIPFPQKYKCMVEFYNKYSQYYTEGINRKIINDINIERVERWTFYG